MPMPEPTQPKYRCPNCGKGLDDEIALLPIVPSDGLVLHCGRCDWVGRKCDLIPPLPITPKSTLHCPKCSLEWVVSSSTKPSDRAACACGWKGYVSNLKRKTGECPYGDPECGCRNGLLPTKTHLERKRNLYAANYGGTAPKPKIPYDYTTVAWDYAKSYSMSVDPAYAKRENEKMKAAVEEMFRSSPFDVNAKLEKEAMSESDTITYMQYDDGQPIDCGTCTTGHGIEEYCGLCQQCWLNLEPAERAILQGKEPPVKEVVNTTNVIHRLNAPSKLHFILDFVWRGWVTGIIGYLTWILWTVHHGK
jgi:hypothetical protein